MNYESETYKLYYQDRLIGKISNIGMDWPWFIADEQANRVEAYIAIHNGNEIWWRW